MSHKKTSECVCMVKINKKNYITISFKIIFYHVITSKHFEVFKFYFVKCVQFFENIKLILILSLVASCLLNIPIGIPASLYLSA